MRYIGYFILTLGIGFLSYWVSGNIIFVVAISLIVAGLIAIIESF